MINRLSILLLSLLLLSACSAKPEPVPFPVSQAELLLERGVDLHGRGDYNDAMFYFSRAVSEFRSLDQRTGLQQAQQNLAETAFLVSQFELALAAAKEAKAIAIELGDKRREHRARLAVARAYSAHTAHEPAVLSTALTALSPLLDSLGPVDAPLQKPAQQWNALERSAVLLRAQIEQQQGVAQGPWLARANQTQLRQDYPLYGARLLRLEAHAAAEQRIEKLNQALRIYTDAGFRPGIAASLEAIAAHYYSEESYEKSQKPLALEQAAAHYERALYVRVWLNDALHIKSNLAALYGLHQQLGNTEQAEGYQTLLQRLSTNPAVALEMRRAM